MKPPKPPKKKSETRHHGIIRHDDFAWMRADNWQEVLHDASALPQPIRQHLDAENDYTDQLLQPVIGLTQTLLEEMKARIPDKDKRVPMPEGDYLYWSAFAKGQEHPSFFRAHRGTEVKMLDAHEAAATHDFFKLGCVCHSDDHRFLAWSADNVGGEYYTINIRDLESGEDIERLNDSDGTCFWVGAQLVYIQMDDNHRPNRIWCHRLGSAQSDDHLMFHEDDPAFFLSVSKSLSGDYIFIHSYDHDSSVVYLLATKDLNAAPQIVKPRCRHVEYDMEHDKKHGRFFILTNQDAVDFKIMIADESTPDQWRDYIPHQKGVYILDMIAFENHLVRLERENGLPQLIVRDLTSETEYRHQISDAPHDLNMTEGFIYQTDQLRLHYSSLKQPEQVFDFDMVRHTQVKRKTQTVVGGHAPDDYVCQRHFASAKDGAEVPISLLFHKNTPPDKTRPLWLYGYGAYGLTIPPRFSTTRLSLVARGWTFAIAHIRGGAAKGRSWYYDGKLEHKNNSFTDFIACAEHLIAINYTSAGLITAQGGSAGGILMGAIANLAPHLFRTIIAQVPFVDVLATMLDANLPLTPPEWLEWGNPIKDKTAYRRIADYSPYDNVRPQAYPWILATSGLSDPRVGYWEAAKWIAKLRDAQKGNAPICLKTEMTAGHGGQAGRFRSLEEIANIYAFALGAMSNSDENLA